LAGILLLQLLSVICMQKQAFSGHLQAAADGMFNAIPGHDGLDSFCWAARIFKHTCLALLS
jgi:hypothetical protein